jgi:hypothetical protein
MIWAAGLSVEVEVNRLMGPSVFIGVGRGRPCWIASLNSYTLFNVCLSGN